MPSHTHCRICKTMLSVPFLDFGPMPLANSFLSSPLEFASEAFYRLAVTACPTCGLVQLNYVVPAEQLYRDYIYVSSTSEAVRLHAEALADGLVRQYGWGSSDLVVEVASNDGTVLKAFRRRRVQVLGVEPARNIAAIAETEGVPTVAEFFDEAVARTLHAEHGDAAGIIGRHVFAHVDDLHGFLEGVRGFLAKDGVFIIEVPYLGDLLENLEFDTIYHEHLSYFSLEPVRRLCELHGLRLVDVERVGLHGGSVVLHMRLAAAGSRRSERLDRMLAEERSLRLSDPARLGAFVRNVSRWKDRFEGLVGEVVRSGGALIGYGAAAKANTLLNFCPEVAGSLRFILDRSPHKHGRYTPGTHIRVEPVERWETDGATHMLVLAWNFADEIMRQMSTFSARGGRFVIPIPELRVI